MIPTPKGWESVVRQARQMLLERGELPDDARPHVVFRSWRRSRDAGLAPTGRLPDVPQLSAGQLARALEQQRELIAHARPVMEYLHAQTRDSGSMVILADHRGLLLQALGDAGFLGRAERVALTPGASWHERHRGTNAIGTAAAEGVPLTVHGAEHYLERNGFLTCAAAPIMSPEGRICGVLDISGDQRSRHPHTFGLVQTAAQMIENRLFQVEHGDRNLCLRFHPLAEGIGTVAEGLVALSEDGWIVAANRAGLELLGIAVADLGTTPLSRLMDVRLADLQDLAVRCDERPLLLRGPRGRLFARVEGGRRPVRALPQVKVEPSDALAALNTGDERMAAAIDRARKILGKPISLLLQGESGVGKEVFAQAVHDSGPRRDGPFVAVNCAALPENLIEAELFGYVPGAFTGARREGSPGRVREAQGGTLFLDEIGDMPLALQARLLRVLQEKRVTPLGSGRAVAVDFSLICASHRNLRAEMEQGRFRTDLYYRINGLTLALPALRDRSDSQVLVRRLLEGLAPGRNLRLAPELSARFADHPWPGNLRQLANALATACAFLEPEASEIDWQHLPDDLRAELVSVTVAELRPPDPAGNLHAMSLAAMSQAVAAAGGNMSEAARRLGVSRNTLYRRLGRPGSGIRRG